MSKILVIDDEAPLRRALRDQPRAHGYEVELAATGREGLDLAAREHPDVVVLDLGLPDMDGIERRRGAAGLEHGADHRALGARRASRSRSPRSTPAPTTTSPSRSGWTSCSPACVPALRRAAPTEQEPVIDDRRLHDRPRREAGPPRTAPRCTSRRPSGRSSRCSCATAGKLVTQRQLLQEVWGPQYETRDPLPARLHGQIRRKLEPDPSRPRYFITEPGMGYRFVMEEP